ncbi:ABC transporter substrate-binding protein [Bacillus sp. REN3]|uniref:ABC transporter substrate-binding protein n=1 Tax=Bacillus sp. REN3 TaxID=2802440 RepID=UPI001AEEBCEA|nr:ABC transporter substrate-binding protein [Bacillus sp. REN3]
MKKLNALLIALLVAVFALAGCGDSTAGEPKDNKEKQTAQEEKSVFPVTVTDARGQEISLDSKPEKIVSVIPSNTEIAYELGLEKEIVGVSDFDNYPEEVAEKEKIGGLEFNIEKVISLKPDLVLGNASGMNSAKDGFKQLEDAGIKVLVVNDAKNFEEVYESIEMIGTATGEKEKAEKLVADMKEKVAEIESKAKGIKEEDKKSVFVEVAPAPEIYAAGKNNFIDEMLQIIHAENSVTQDGWPKLDSEAVVKSNPDVIVTTHGYYTNDPVKNVTSREGWQGIKAVKENRVIDVHSDKVTRTGPRLVEGLEEMAKAVYPDVFK